MTSIYANQNLTIQSQFDRVTENSKASFFQSILKEEMTIQDNKIDPVAEQDNEALKVELRKRHISEQLFNINPDHKEAVIVLINKLKKILRQMKACEQKMTGSSSHETTLYFFELIKKKLKHLKINTIYINQLEKIVVSG